MNTGTQKMTKFNNVLITGASAGLGEALAKKFAELGANLTLSARREDRLRDLRNTLIKINPKIDIHLVPADVSKKESCQELVNESVKHFGELNVFVANAGQGMWSRFRDLSDPDQIDDVMQTNYMGVVYGLFYALPYLRQSRGSFVAISSIQGIIPVAFHTGYVASKYAVNGLIETIRLEESDVHFLLALPSWISGTELRANALTGDADEAVHVKLTHNKSAVSARDCAGYIVDALIKKKPELFIPHKYRFLSLIRNMCKAKFDQVVLSKTKGQLKT